MTIRKSVGIMALLATAASVFGQPGVSAPIRVGTFMGTGTGRYWHTNILTAQPALGTILANPNNAGLGPNLVVPTAGFTFTQFGVTATGSPTAAQTTAFINALASLDVVYIGCFVDLGNIISSAANRTALRNFIATKGYVSIHATNDSYGTWTSLDSLQAARFANHPSSDRTATIRRDSVAQTDPSWIYLNRGLFANGTDTNFLEEWFSYTTSGSAIRAGNNLGTQRISTKMDEASYAGGMGGATQMGDHPMSWFRDLTTGGRLFYSGVGHRVQNYQSGANPRFLRRQIYNAILWTAKYDQVVAIRHEKAPGAASDYSSFSLSGSDFSVTMLLGGEHSVELVGMDGKRVASQTGRGEAGKSYVFAKPRPGVYALAVATHQGRASRLITIQ